MSENDADQRLPKRAETGRWLGVETSGFHGSAAAAEATGDELRVIASAALRRDQRSARALAPAIDELLRGLSWQPSSLANVAVATGPGSFTGLRVGVVTSKALAYATGAAVLGVDTLDVLAEAVPPTGDAQRLWAAVDAQRGECFLAKFERSDNGWRRVGDNQRRSLDEARRGLAAGDRVIGPIADALADGRCQAEPQEPDAEAVLRVAWRGWKEGQADNVYALAPRYHRPSAAEEKIEQHGV